MKGREKKRVVGVGFTRSLSHGLTTDPIDAVRYGPRSRFYKYWPCLQSTTT